MPRHTYPRPRLTHSRAHVRLQAERWHRKRLRTLEFEHIDSFEFQSDLRRHTRITFGDVWEMRRLCDPRNPQHVCGEPQHGRPVCCSQAAARQLYDYLETTPQRGPLYSLTLDEAVRLPREARDWLGLAAVCHLDDRLHRRREFWEWSWDWPISERSAQRKRRNGWRRQLEQDESSLLSTDDDQPNGLASSYS